MPSYTYNRTKVAIDADPLRTFVFPGNSRRVSLILSMGFSKTVGVFCDEDEVSGELGSLAWLAFPGTHILPFRDYGPSIQGEVYITAQGGALALTVTEVIEQ